MPNRRGFFKQAIAALTAAGVQFAPLRYLIDFAHGQNAKTVVPKDIPWTDLRNWDPKGLDTTNLPITPIENFGAMGLEDYSADLEAWRLIIEGEVDKPLSLPYTDVLNLPSVERAVLMICPGFFVNHGLWTGVSVPGLLKSAAVRKGVTHVTFTGPEGPYAKSHRVPLSEALSDQVFVAYKVNGARLPQKHGFPLRLVAEGYYGYDWVKYVYKATADIVPGDRNARGLA